MLENLKKYLDACVINYYENVNLSTKTWIKTGGICHVWIMPNDVSQLEMTVSFLYKNKIPFKIVGQTSNLFFHSNYNPAVLVSTLKVNGYVVEDDILTCSPGTNVMKVAKEMLKQGYAGFYGLVGLPGTMGAAIINNSGCFNCSPSSMLIGAKFIMEDNKIMEFSKEDMKYSHRSSLFKRKECRGVLLSLRLKLAKADDINDEIRKSEETILYRKQNQEGPKLNLGSTFSKLETRRSLRNTLIHYFFRIIKKFVKFPKNVYYTALLLVYNYWDLRPYVSKKNINTFIWNGEEAELKFKRYKDFMKKVFDNPSLEIEEICNEKN